jgi:hypothetical protein
MKILNWIGEHPVLSVVLVAVVTDFVLEIIKVLMN